MCFALSIRSLDCDSIIDLICSVYFGKVRAEWKLEYELGCLRLCGFSFFQVFDKLDTKHQDEILRRTVRKYGSKAIAKESMALLLEDKYRDGALPMFHRELAEAFCHVKDVMRSIVSQNGHVALVQKGWNYLKGRSRTGSPTGSSGYDFSPRDCVIQIPL